MYTNPLQMRLSDFSRLCQLLHVQNFQIISAWVVENCGLNLNHLGLIVCVHANRDIKLWLADEVFRPLSNRFSSLLENSQKKRCRLWERYYLFPFPALDSPQSHTATGGVFHWLLSIWNLQVPALAGFWVQWNGGAALARLGKGIFCAKTLASCIWKFPLATK